MCVCVCVCECVSVCVCVCVCLCVVAKCMYAYVQLNTTVSTPVTVSQLCSHTLWGGGEPDALTLFSCLPDFKCVCTKVV